MKGETGCENWNGRWGSYISTLAELISNFFIFVCKAIKKFDGKGFMNEVKAEKLLGEFMDISLEKYKTYWKEGGRE